MMLRTLFKKTSMSTFCQGLFRAYAVSQNESAVKYPVPTRVFEGGGEDRCKLPGPGGPEGSRGPNCVACVFVFLGNYLSTVLINSCRTSPYHTATENQGRPLVYIFAH